MEHVHTLVLGAGIVGVCSALHLQAMGREVMLMDRAAPGSGTSHGNAGLIERSSVVPYAFPHNLGRLLRYGLNREPDVRYSLRHLPAIASRLLAYWRHSSPAGLASATQAMLPLVQQCVIEHDRLIEAAGLGHLVSNGGWMEVFRQPADFAAALAQAAALSQHGLRTQVLEGEQLRAQEPALSAGAVGAIHWQDPTTVNDPGALTRGYAELFERRGGALVLAEAKWLFHTGRYWVVDTPAGPISSDEVVVAMGPQANTLLEPLGYRIPLFIKRGYHMHYKPIPGHELRQPICDTQGGYVLAPMAAGVRLTTGIEFAASDAPTNHIQLNRCEALARRIYPLGERIDPQPWLGLRPCLPDMRPVIGPAGRHPGLWFNFGHAHHGLTLGPVSGRLLAQMMTGQPTLTDPRPYAPGRFKHASS